MTNTFERQNTIGLRLRTLLALAPLIAAMLSSAQFRKGPATVEPPATSPLAPAGITYTEVTRSSGLSAFQRVSGSAVKDYILETMGGGAVFIDYDNDGWQDVYLVNGGTVAALLGKERLPRSALFHNERNGTFTDVTARAGVPGDQWGQGACVGDIDNDGWPDLYVTNFGKNRLYRNNHDGTFTDVAERAGVGLGDWSTGCAFGDFDRDGFLDLFVAGYIEYDPRSPPPGVTDESSAAASRDGQGQGITGVGAAYSPGARFCQYRGVRVNCGPRGLKGRPDHLFRNRRDGTFEDVSVRAGVADRVSYYGIGVAWLDYDDDGWQDLFVANDARPNYLYRNRQDGTFEDVSFLSGTAMSENGTEQACMGVAVGDYDGDGRDDIHVTNFADDSNTLYRNNGNGTFDDRTFTAGLGDVTNPFVGWGTAFLDFDHDRSLDLVVVNGHVYPQADAAGWNTTYRQRMLVFRGVEGRFYDVSASLGEAVLNPRCARGAAVGDFDNDGDLDVLTNHLEGVPSLFRNDGGNRAGHWITVRLAGDPARGTPRDAVGSVVFCTAGGRRMRGEVASGRSYLSQSDMRVHFGLGPAEKIESLEVRWSGGAATEYTVPGRDSFITIDQARGVLSNR